MLAEYLHGEYLFGFLTLTALEIVLGIDNIVFLAIVVEKLKKQEQAFARKLGLFLAMLMRIVLLLCISWVMKLTNPLFTAYGHEFSFRNLILLVGGLFLIVKATMEIHEKMEGPRSSTRKPKTTTLTSAIVQIVLLDLVFSLDSVITAVGMVDKISIMIAAVVVSVAVMIAFSGTISRFVNQHPTLKMLAMAFLIMIGVMLVAESIGQHINRGYIYFGMVFALAVEVLNIKANKSSA